ncbi:TIGR03557 family F420-dependent LLM class oxidoreductase [Uniformispora flossi]|uniref:TIGR03557 family F420-dependent LLM class oxidoreductase n=1 Tax=Uniformispora flossi TaxID=3390723 RepID=UPI003C2CFE1E
MARIGYFLSCEEYTPAELIDQARLAEKAGFAGLAISDHFHPWNEAQGNSPFVWSVIGALSQVTALPVTTLVTCPTVRLHPAVTAQAAATAAVMTAGRFRLGVGTGEALNEHVTGAPWPAWDVRADMLAEAVEVMRRLFTGETITHRGRHYTADNARLYTVPQNDVPIYVSAFGPQSLDLAARIGDGLVTTQPDPDAVRAFRDSRGRGPVLGGLKVCWDGNRDRAVETAHRLWAVEQLPGELGQVLPTPQHFEQAAGLVTPDIVAKSVTCGDDVEEHVAGLRAFADAGFDEVFVGQIGTHHEEFFRAYGERVLPAVQG